MKVRYYIVKTVDGHVVQITERKPTKRDAQGRFVGKGGGHCRWYGVCPFTTKGR